MTREKDQRPVLIVGASSDIAIQLAHIAAEAGHPIHLAGRDLTPLEPVASDLQIRHAVKVETHLLDVVELTSIGAALDSMRPQPHIVISMVGFMGDQTQSETDIDAAKRVIETNLTGPAALIEASAQRFASIEEPTVLVGVSSVAGDRGRARNYYYGAAKAGFTAMLSGLRQRLNGSSTTVITIKPGFVKTRMTENMDLPAPLVESDLACAKRIYKSIQKRREIVYPWKWRLLMTIIRAIPEPIFKRLSF